MTVVRRQGRKRKLASRYPSGAIRRPGSRERVERITRVAVNARSRVYGLSRAQANQPRAGDMLGRLFMTGEINRDQHEAGVLYAQHRVDYDRAMLAQRLVTAGDPLDRGGYDARDGTDPDYRTFVRRVVARHARVRQALGACHDPLAGMVLDAVVLEEREMWNFVGTLRLALNAVGRVLR